MRPTNTLSALAGTGIRRVLCVTCVAWAAVVAQAAVVCPERPITLAFFQTPVLYMDGQGLDKDIVDELQARSKCRFETSVMPRARVWIEIKEGRLDMTTSVLPTPEREQAMWIANYLQLRNYLLLSKELAGRVKSLQELSSTTPNLRLGMVRGYKHGDAYDAWLAGLAAENRVQEVVETAALYQMLKLGRVNGFVSTPMTYMGKLQEFDMADQVAIMDWGGDSASSPRGLGLSKRNFSEAQAREWQALLDGMKRDGTIRRLIEKYMGKHDAKAMLLK